MNPEIRFRVPRHVLELAQERALEYGLSREKGRTGGASQLARGALYTALGLSLPDDLHELQEKEFLRVRKARERFQTSPGRLTVQVYHRVSPEYRKEAALNRQTPVSARSTTTLEFAQGELPDFLVPYIVLTEDGIPYATLNLEGRLSPRPNALGEMVCATPRCTLKELEENLTRLRREQLQKEQDRQAREVRRRKGLETLARWARQHGSELVNERLEGGFEWEELATDEYAQSWLKRLGITSIVKVSMTTGLDTGPDQFREFRRQDRPDLESMRRLKQFQELAEEGLTFALITCRDHRGRLCQGIQITLETPLPGRRSYLTDLQPIT